MSNPEPDFSEAVATAAGLITHARRGDWQAVGALLETRPPLLPLALVELGVRLSRLANPDNPEAALTRVQLDALTDDAPIQRHRPVDDPDAA